MSPHYLDILPVYMVVLAMVPAAVALSRLHRLAVPAVSILLWLAAGHFGWNLPTEPTEPRGWFFDPFCWQLLFFSGFSLSMKWVAPPPADRRIFWAAVAYLAIGVALTVPVIFLTVPGLDVAEDLGARPCRQDHARPAAISCTSSLRPMSRSICCAGGCI